MLYAIFIQVQNHWNLLPVGRHGGTQVPKMAPKAALFSALNNCNELHGGGEAKYEQQEAGNNQIHGVSRWGKGHLHLNEQQLQ
jgi:hypothetical protein